MNTFEIRRAETQIKILGNGFWVAFVDFDVPENDFDYATQGAIEIFSEENTALLEYANRMRQYGGAKLGKFTISNDGDLEIVPLKGGLNFDNLVSALHEKGMFTHSDPDFVLETLNERQCARLFSEIVSGAIIVDKSQDQDSHA